jgi:hypothetical protein
MAVCMYEEHERQAREAANVAYLAEPGFAELEAKAQAKGFRKATISEINASAERSNWAPDLFCWLGGLWVRMEVA